MPETAEAVNLPAVLPVTSLKRGVNERGAVNGDRSGLSMASEADGYG